MPQPFEARGGIPALPVPVRWEIASDERFRHVVRSGSVWALPQLGHSVHVEVDRAAFITYEQDGTQHVKRWRLDPPRH